FRARAFGDGPVRVRPAQSLDGAAVAGGGAGGTHGRAELHERLVEVAGAVLRDERGDGAAQLGGRGVGVVEETAEDAADVAVDRGGGDAVGDAGDRAGGVVA